MAVGTGSTERKIFEIIGPGILYAAAAVGVSHLVQATRAGANFGLSLTLVIVIACVLKYPTLRFGGMYSSATGETLIASYRQDGWIPFIIYAVAQIFSMVFVVAALGLFTTGLIQVSLGFKVNNIIAISVLLACILLMLLTGKYRVLEKVTKYIVAAFTVMIVFATALVLPKIHWSFAAFAVPELSFSLVPFLLALMGFMPTPAEGSVLQSIWTCARAKDCGQMANQKDAALDFNFGFCITIVLAMCFLFLGAGVMHSAGVEVVKSNFGFSRQLMELFTKTIGSWSFPLIALSSVSVMFSTMYTVVDGYTRIVVELVDNGFPNSTISRKGQGQKAYAIISIILCIAAVLVLATMMQSFATFMDLTSVIVFVTSPLIAILNHMAVFGRRMPVAQRPGPGMKLWSYVGIAFFSIVTLIYVYVKFIL
ncbi:hypothetical protein GO013_06375 [Pseudodesulfovibrio sp. JC047]|uniref:Nramp family divalent metal transporter n=1 Tax=Pseudodesulfovibrio sp. JC047 TaxID=2683199 RepID=UPI0013CFCAB6|nr:Nramp family divalent metal transporter [Pseudodesulfovibrio sp. JC047]NDV19044.1 hypothetical protein [Pseudodesulfovibrio sp. JC047]